MADPLSKGINGVRKLIFIYFSFDTINFIKEQVIMTEYDGNHVIDSVQTSKRKARLQILKVVIINVAVVVYFVFATLEYIKSSKFNH